MLRIASILYAAHFLNLHREINMCIVQYNQPLVNVIYMLCTLQMLSAGLDMLHIGSIPYAAHVPNPHRVINLCIILNDNYDQPLLVTVTYCTSTKLRVCCNNKRPVATGYQTVA
jgi:hypothetical protein